MELAHRTRGEESRARLLAAAAQEFAQHGYYETKVSTIVADAGVSQPTFYIYFSSKEAIFAELVRSFRKRLLTLAKDEPFPAGLTLSSVKSQWQAKMEALFQLFVEDPNITRLSLAQAPDAEQIKQEMAEMLRHRLQIMQEAGYVHPDVSINVTADYLQGAMERLTERYLLTGKSDPKSLARQVVEIGFNGLFTRHTPFARSDETNLDISQGEDISSRN